MILGILSVAAYSLYQYNAYIYLHGLELSGVVIDYSSPLYVYGDIANCFMYITFAFTYFFISRGESDRLRWLVYWAVSLFWFFLAVTYGYNRIFNDFVQFNRLIIVLIGVVIILPICFLISSTFRK